MTQRPKLWPFWLPWQVEKHCVPVSFSNPFSVIACVASVSCEFIKKVGTRAKKRNDGGGGGERRKRLPTNPTILKIFVHPQMQLLIGAVLVLSINSDQYFTKNLVCFVYMRHRSGLIRSLVADKNALDWYLFESCLCEGLSVKANLLGMTACGSDWKNGLFVGDNINVNQNIGTRHKLKMPWTSDLSTLWKEKILFVYWKFSSMYCRKIFNKGLVKRSDCRRSARLIASRVNCSGQIISLRCFDKVSDEIKPHKVPNLTWQ